MKVYITVFLYISFLFLGCKHKTTDTQTPELTGQVTTLYEQLPITAFGEVQNAENTPIIQLDNKYVIDPTLRDDLKVTTASGGSANSNKNLFQVQSGTTSGAYSILTSKSPLIYRAGEGIDGRFTALFTTGVSSSLQFAGLYTASDLLAFGYNGAVFSALHSYGGIQEIQVVTVTATGGGTLTVTLNNTGSGAISVGTGSTASGAALLRTGLAASVLAADWEFQQIGATVVCLAKTVGDKTGTMSVVGAGGATGSIAEQVAGLSPSTSHTPQSSWNITTLPFTGYDPTNLNLYKITLGYLGVADIIYWVYNPYTAKYVAVHQEKWANGMGGTNTPHLTSPDLKIGIGVQSNGSTTNLTVQSASMYMGLQGKHIISPGSFSFTSPTKTVSSTEIPLLSLESRIVFGNRPDRGRIFPAQITASNVGTKTLFIKIRLNPTSLTGSNFSYIDQYNSIALESSSSTAFSGGRVIATYTLAATDSLLAPLTNLGLELLPSDRIIITGLAPNASSDVSVSINWREEK